MANRVYEYLKGITGRNVVKHVEQVNGKVVRFEFDGDVPDGAARRVQKDSGWFSRVHGRHMWVDPDPPRRDYGEPQPPRINMDD